MTFPNRFAGHHRIADPCQCPTSHFDEPRSQWLSKLHTDRQDTDCAAWQQLLELIDQTAHSGATTFAPGLELGPDLWRDIVTLPRSIERLTEVTTLNLYGSNLRSIPPEIGQMRSLRMFEPYCSYRLHWFPYEITRCTHLDDSTVSTRAVYGNHKFRPTFPRLPAELPPESTPSNCSVCNSPFDEHTPKQFWISLRVATDVLPLLGHGCSNSCVEALPTPPDNYLEQPHQGGKDLQQPPMES